MSVALLASKYPKKDKKSYIPLIITYFTNLNIYSKFIKFKSLVKLIYTIKSLCLKNINLHDKIDN